MEILNQIRERAKADIKRIVFPESTDERMLNAVVTCNNEKLCVPVLVGIKNDIEKAAKENNIDLAGIEIVDVQEDTEKDNYINTFYEMRKHKRVDMAKATELMADPLYYSNMMLKEGRVDGSVAGAVNTTGDVLRSTIHVIGAEEGCSVISSIFLMVLPNGKALTFADCGVNPNPDAAQLADIAIASAKTHKQLTNEDPIVAMLSFSTKGSARHQLVTKVQEALEIAKSKNPDFPIDGELQADAALVESVGQKKAPGSDVAGKANVLIFPDLQAGNIAYKLVERLAGAEALGPILQGTAKPINDLSRGCKAEDIVNVACISSLKAQTA